MYLSLQKAPVLDQVKNIVYLLKEWSNNYLVYDLGCSSSSHFGHGVGRRGVVCLVRESGINWSQDETEAWTEGETGSDRGLP